MRREEQLTRGPQAIIRMERKEERPAGLTAQAGAPAPWAIRPKERKERVFFLFFYF
jgi:hypothetical protein